MASEKSLEEQFPSVDLAYEIAQQSYSVAIKRSDVADDGIDKMRSFIITVTLAFVAWMLTRNPSGIVINLPFEIAAWLFLWIIVLSIIAKSKGYLTVPDPQILYAECLHLTHWEFKRNFVSVAGKHFKKNKDYVWYKSEYIIAMFILFLFEFLSLCLWWSSVPSLMQVAH